MPVAVMFVLAVPIAPATVVVPTMIVANAAPLTFPVACEIAFPVMPRNHPYCSWIGWPAPISVMPLVVVADRVPVALNPHEFGPWSYRPHPHYPRGRWRADLDSDRNLRKGGASRKEH